MQTLNCGNHVGYICGFPRFYGIPKNEAQIAQNKQAILSLAQELKEIKYKYIFGVTADCVQSELHPIFEEQGFRKVIIFNSSHGGNEKLTLWTKTFLKNAKLPAIASTIVPAHNYYNCSLKITSNLDHQYHSVFFININHPADGMLPELKEKSNEELKGKGFKRIKNTPIWFKLSPAAEIKTE